MVNSICLLSGSQPACCTEAAGHAVSSPCGKELTSLVTSQKGPEDLPAATEVILSKASLEMPAALPDLSCSL